MHISFFEVKNINCVVELLMLNCVKHRVGSFGIKTFKNHDYLLFVTLCSRIIKIISQTNLFNLKG